MFKKSLLVWFVSLLIGTSASAQEKKVAYRLYDGQGRAVSYERMLKVLSRQDVVFFGEYHNNPIAHWLELELVKDLHTRRSLIIGAEMFETDNQAALSDYLDGKIDRRALDSLARLWRNYSTDYAPLVEFARTNRLPVIATNIPRKYAAAVSREGFTVLDSLMPSERAFMAPLPIAYDPELPSYKRMRTMRGDHAGENFPKAQAIKDATMAYFIAKHFAPGKLFLHINGAYHSDHREGIVWYLNRLKPELRCKTISTVLQADVNRLHVEHRGRADFILCVDEDMTTTY